MALFIKILLTMFIAEMGDKTQLLLVAMTSRFKLRDIILAPPPPSWSSTGWRWGWGP